MPPQLTTLRKQYFSRVIINVVIGLLLLISGCGGNSRKGGTRTPSEDFVKISMTHIEVAKGSQDTYIRLKIRARNTQNKAIDLRKYSFEVMLKGPIVEEASARVAGSAQLQSLSKGAVIERNMVVLGVKGMTVQAVEELLRKNGSLVVLILQEGDNILSVTAHRLKLK